MKVYDALQLSLLTDAAPAWQPWPIPARIEQLECCKNIALRVVIGQLKSTPVETLQREAGICSIATASKGATPLVYEKAHRLPLGQPRRRILAAPSRLRLKRSSWRSAAQARISDLPAELDHRAFIDSPFSCPCVDSSNWSVQADNLSPPGSQDDTIHQTSNSSPTPMAR